MCYADIRQFGLLSQLTSIIETSYYLNKCYLPSKRFWCVWQKITIVASRAVHHHTSKQQSDSYYTTKLPTSFSIAPAPATHTWTPKYKIWGVLSTAMFVWNCWHTLKIVAYLFINLFIHSIGRWSAFNVHNNVVDMRCVRFHVFNMYYRNRPITALHIRQMTSQCITRRVSPCIPSWLCNTRFCKFHHPHPRCSRSHRIYTNTRHSVIIPTATGMSCVSTVATLAWRLCISLNSRLHKARYLLILVISTVICQLFTFSRHCIWHTSIASTISYYISTVWLCSIHLTTGVVQATSPHLRTRWSLLTKWPGFMSVACDIVACDVGMDVKYSARVVPQRSTRSRPASLAAWYQTQVHTVRHASRTHLQSINVLNTISYFYMCTKSA